MTPAFPVWRATRKRELIASHFSSFHHTFLPFITLSLLSFCVTLPLSSHLFSSRPGPVQPSIHPVPFYSPHTPHAPRTTPRPCLPASFQSINSVLMCYAVPMISDHLQLPLLPTSSSLSLPGTGSRPGITVRIYVAPVCSCFMEETKTQRSMQREKKGENDRATGSCEVWRIFKSTRSGQIVLSRCTFDVEKTSQIMLSLM